MSFSFNFFDSDNNKIENFDVNPSTGVNDQHELILMTQNSDSMLIQLVPIPSLTTSDISQIAVVQILDVSIKKCNPPDSLQQQYGDSDLVKGVYEGGLKVWECSIDLSEYLLENKQKLPIKKEEKMKELPKSNGRVLELGCGHGIPGIIALTLGCEYILFSDFNKEVLEHCTWANVSLNFPDRSNSSSVSCISGDWEDLSAFLTKNRELPFSLILSAETLYTEDCCRKLLIVLKKHLAVDGIALIASKKFYFGLGGGTLTLEDMIKRQNVFSFRLLKIFDDGASNIREIISISWKR